MPALGIAVRFGWDMMGKEQMEKYWLWLVGMPAETARAAAR